MDKTTNDLVNITGNDISGLVHSILIIRGKLYSRDIKFILFGDDKEIDYKLDIIDYSGEFNLSAPIDSSIKNIKLYSVMDNDKKLIYELKNSIVKRIIYKVKAETKLFGNKIVKAFGFVLRAFRFFLRNFSYIIIPHNWPRYWNIFVKKIKGGDALYNPFNTKEYNLWFNENYKVDEPINFEYNPKISILIPVYNIERKYLVECIDSILRQTYQNFEICIADDNSNKEETIKTLKEYEKKDDRIKVVYRKQNGHISEATNSALTVATGEYVALMDDDDVITVDALYEFVKVLNKNPELDLIYSDEDKMEMSGTLCEPHFKPDYSPDTLFGGNYICHFSIYRKKIVEEIGGFRTEFNGAQDFDLVLRFVEKTDKIYHIDKILYHCRKIPGSTAVTVDNKEYAILNGKKAVAEALVRRNRDGKVMVPINSTHYIVLYDVKDNPKVSIVIPNKDNSSVLNNCLKSIYNNTSYKNYEVIVIDNNSKQSKTFKLYEKYEEKYKNFRIIKTKYEYNYAKLNNDAIRESAGDYIVLLGYDTVIETKDWLEIMIGYAEQNHIGAVGAKLLYPDRTIRSGGIILGLMGVGGDAYNGVEGSSYGTYGRLLVPYDYSALSGLCLMISKKKYNEVNGMDEKLKISYSDIDLNIKLLEKGYYNIFLPMVKAICYESKSNSSFDTVKKHENDNTYMKEKWGKLLNKDKFYNKNYSLKWWFMLDKGKNNNEKDNI